VLRSRSVRKLHRDPVLNNVQRGELDNNPTEEPSEGKLSAAQNSFSAAC
jgi:hypothetical protein